MMDPGKIIICMDKEFILGVMVENTMVNTTWIRNMGTEFTIGLMVEGMKATGVMENSTARGSTCCLMG